MPGIVDFDEAPPGVCLIWSVSYDELVGAYVGANANDLEGCFDLSNPIEVNRVSCEVETECPEFMNLCTNPTTEIIICIPCIADGSFDATITEVISLFDCGIDDLDDDNDACFSYTPLPFLQNYGPDKVTVEYCTSSGECKTTEISMDILEECPGVVNINTIPHGFNEDLLPSGDFINVALNAEIEKADLTIYNLNGQTMKTKVVENGTGDLNVLRLDITEFNSGIYYLVARFGDSVQATQFIKK